MTAPFECEVRFLVDDREALQRRLTARGGRVRFEYAFTDHYFRLAGGPGDPHTRTLRIREHHRPAQPCEVLLTWTDLVQFDGLSFKRSRFPEGKVRLYAGTLASCRTVADGLGYEPWLVVRKLAGIFYEIPDIGEFVIEEVEGIGWMGEVEVAGENPSVAAAAIRAKLQALGVPLQAVLPQPLAALGASRSGRGRKVYFCGSISGGRALQPVYAAIVAFLQDRGWEVLTNQVAAPDVLAQEARAGGSASDIYARDMRWLEECDLVIAEVSVPSLGVGVELAMAQYLGKPLLCLCRSDVALSAMVDGNANVRVLRYRDAADLMSRLQAELADVESLPRVPDPTP